MPRPACSNIHELPAIVVPISPKHPVVVVGIGTMGLYVLQCTQPDSVASLIQRQYQLLAQYSSVTRTCAAVAVAVVAVSAHAVSSGVTNMQAQDGRTSCAGATHHAVLLAAILAAHNGALA
jgi:hypothetical protein